jgi:DNA-binding transcriptional ArsR family regulator
MDNMSSGRHNPAMRPLFHPAADDITVECILHALSDPIRVQIFASISMAGCAQTCSAFLEISDKAIPKSTLSQHFKVLREAGLIRSERKGVEMHNTPRHDDLHARFGPLIKAIVDAHVSEGVRQRKAERSKKLKKAA